MPETSSILRDFGLRNLGNILRFPQQGAGQQNGYNSTSENKSLASLGKIPDFANLTMPDYPVPRGTLLDIRV